MVSRHPVGNAINVRLEGSKILIASDGFEHQNVISKHDYLTTLEEGDVDQVIDIP